MSRPPARTSHDLAQLRPLLDASLDGVILTDLHGLIVEFNPAAESMFGRRRDAVLGKPVGSVVVPPHLRDRHEASLKRRMSSGSGSGDRLRFETEGMRSDGTILPVELTVTELLLPQGEKLLLAYLRDITARTQLRISEERYRLAMRGSNEGLFEWDVENGTAFYSERLEEIVGRRASELTAIDSWHVNVHPEDLASLKEGTRRLLRAETDHIVLEYRIRRSDGAERWVQTTAAVKRAADGRALRIAGSVGDITDRKRAADEIERQREALYQSEKLSALGSLLAGVAHELNNPLSIVVGQAQMLLEQSAGTAFAERAAKIETAAARCARIARTFLAMARQRQPSRRPVMLGRVIDDVLGLLDYGLRSAGIIVERRIAPDLPALHADPDQLNQVFSNLLINAQQALSGRPEPRRIVVAASLSDDRQFVEARVSDNGPGIPAALRRRIFEPFFTTKPTGSGTGIGLSVSHGIVAAHGGTLQADEGTGGGAEFLVRLPIGTGEAEPRSGSKPAEADLRPGRALIVDDETGVADLLGEILRNAGLDIVVARDGHDALRQVATGEFAVLLTDLRMPGLDGRGLFLELRRRFPALAKRVVFVTGDMLSPDTADFLRESGQPCLEKPFSPGDVRHAIAQVLQPG